MGAHDTQQHARNAEQGNPLSCQWERTAYGGLIARWRRVDPGIPLSEAQAVRAQSRADRRRWSLHPRRASKRLIAAGLITTLYLVTGFSLFSVFVGQSTIEVVQ
jgi:hypothetical protein